MHHTVEHICENQNLDLDTALAVAGAFPNINDDGTTKLNAEIDRLQNQLWHVQSAKMRIVNIEPEFMGEPPVYKKLDVSKIKV